MIVTTFSVGSVMLILVEPTISAYIITRSSLELTCSSRNLWPLSIDVLYWYLSLSTLSKRPRRKLRSVLKSKCCFLYYPAYFPKQFHQKFLFLIGWSILSWFLLLVDFRVLHTIILYNSFIVFCFLRLLSKALLSLALIKKTNFDRYPIDLTDYFKIFRILSRIHDLLF